MNFSNFSRISTHATDHRSTAHQTEGMPRHLLTVLIFALSYAIQPPANTCGDDFPRIVIGCWQLLERHADEAMAVETLKAYAASGFHVFDTADIYGRSESVLGALKNELSEPISIHTKYVTSSAALREARHINTQSRTALGLKPDLVAFHWWDYADPSFVKAAHHLVTLQSEGKLGRVAACNFDVEHLKAMVEGGVPIVSNQVQYSLLDRRPENGMLKYAKQHGIRLATFGVVAGGWLSDAWLGKPAPGRAAMKTVSMRMYKSRLDAWTGGDWELFQELLRTLRAVADKSGTTIANVAAAWVLHQLGPDGGWVILGVRDTRHLDEHKALLHHAGVGVEATTGDGTTQLLSEADDARIRAVLDKGNAPRGDIWSHERGYA